MLNLGIGNKEYHIEFTVEASLHNECTQKVTDLMLELTVAGNKSIKDTIKSMTNIPQTTLTMFYAGLLEHHGEEGDKTVMSESDAKALVKQYLKENKDNEKGNFYAIMEMLIAQMGEDGFFKQIGLEQMIKSIQAKNQTKTPTDHKAKSKKVTSK